MKRTRINPRSAKKIAADKAKPEVREAVFKRDAYRCILSHRSDLPRCFGAPMTPHHLRKEKHGGDYSVGQLVTLCSFHNTWVEDNPSAAHTLGLVVRSGETLDDAWRKMRANGLVAW